MGVKKLEDLKDTIREPSPFDENHGSGGPPHIEEGGDDGEGNWLISYADLMTLLVGFFVVLQSFSKPDAQSFEQIKKETTQLFGGEYKIPYEELSKALKDVIKDQALTEQVVFRQNDKGIEITFRGALFFESGSFTLKEEAIKVLNQLIPIISEKAKDFGVVVEGHTDSRTLNNSHGPLFSNWELSGVRASVVVRMFLEKGFSPLRIRALGLADSHPIMSEKNEHGQEIPENMAQNRRVVVKILKDFQD